MNMDFGECGQTAQTFNEEIFLHKFDKIGSTGIYSTFLHDTETMLCNTNFLIHNHFWHRLDGWPTSNVYPCDPKLGKANDILFQEKIIELGGQHIIPRNVLFYHFGGRNIRGAD